MFKNVLKLNGVHRYYKESHEEHYEDPFIFSFLNPSPKQCRDSSTLNPKA